MKNLRLPVVKSIMLWRYKLLLVSPSIFLAIAIPGVAATVSAGNPAIEAASLSQHPSIEAANSIDSIDTLNPIEATRPSEVAAAKTSIQSTDATDSLRTSRQQPVAQPVTIARVTSVSGLSDVRPTDWAFQALQSLVERYGMIAGFPDGTFRGNRSMTRYEFAAGLNAAIDQINELIKAGLDDKVSKADLETLQKLQKEFEKEITTLRGRVDTLEGRVKMLELFQFSTTTRLTGQALFAINGGFQTHNAKPNPGGNLNPNTIFNSRVLLNLETSFTGRDRLSTQLQVSTSTVTSRVSGSPGFATDAAGFLADDSSANFYSINRLGTGFQLNRLSYAFPLGNDINVTLFPRGYASDYVDNLTYANKQFDNAMNFSTFSLTSNILLFAQDFVSSGAAVVWHPKQGPFTFRAVYAAQDATVPGATGLTTLPTGLGSITDAYGNPGGDRRGGLFGDPYLGILEAEYAPTPDFAVRGQYVNGEVGGRKYEAVGANLEYRFLRKAAVFARFGYSPHFFPFRFFGGEKPFLWQIGFAFPDLFVRSDLLGVSAAQPLIIDKSVVQPNVSGKQTNIEVFYNYPISENIRITPLVQVIVNPLNNSDRGTVFTGTLRTVFSF